MRPEILREGTGRVNSSKDMSDFRKSTGYVLLGPEMLNSSRDMSEESRKSREERVLLKTMRWPPTRSGGGNMAGGRLTITTPTIVVVATNILHRPQWSLRMIRESVIVKAGSENIMAVESPRGSLATASRIERRRNPPRTP